MFLNYVLSFIPNIENIIIHLTYFITEDVKTEAREIKTEIKTEPPSMKPPPEKKPRIS